MNGRRELNVERRAKMCSFLLFYTYDMDQFNKKELSFAHDLCYDFIKHQYCVKYSVFRWRKMSRIYQAVKKRACVQYDGANLC